MKTRVQLQEDAQARIYKLINEIMVSGVSEEDDKARGAIMLEMDGTQTSSDEWYELAEAEKDPKRATLYFKTAQVVLVRNAYADGLPFCPLCGKIGTPEHNGAPLADEKVCEACNQRKVIPARIRAAQKEAE